MSEAKKDQGNEYYPGVDNWKPHTITRGTLICQLDFRTEEQIREKKTPVSDYFTNGDLKVNKVDELPSAKDLSEQVQVKPFRPMFSSGEHTYQPAISFYEVKQPIACETSNTQNNPLYGKGGAVQYYIPDKVELAKSGHLELKDVIQTSQRNHDLPFFKTAEELKLTNKEIKEITPLKHEEILRKMEAGDEPTRKIAAQMRELMKESSDLKEGKTITTTKEPSREEDQSRSKGLRR